MTYPSILKTGALKDVFTKIVKTGIPSKFTIEHLKSLGYTSSNDQPILSVLKFIGFLDGSGVPTEKYKNYRGGTGARVLANAIKSGYLELFQLYPDANEKDEESLTHFFATKTSVGERSLKAMVSTFRTLCSIANFKSTDHSGPPNEIILPVTDEKVKEVSLSKMNGNPAININIELQVPATNDPEVYKNFFEAMKKYLLSN